MTDVVAGTQRLLREAGMASVQTELPGATALVFEGATVLGFVLIYDDVESLLGRWRRDTHSLIAVHQFGLRRAQSKAWNTYEVLVGLSTPTDLQRAALRAIEEDLVGTRKIAWGGAPSPGLMKEALLPLLPLQHAPYIEAIDMKAEIRLRTTEIPPDLVDTFLSAAAESHVAQALEDRQ